MMKATNYVGVNRLLYSGFVRLYKYLPRWFKINALDYFRNDLTRRFMSCGTEEERTHYAREIQLISINIDVLKNGGYYR